MYGRNGLSSVGDRDAMRPGEQINTRHNTVRTCDAHARARCNNECGDDAPGCVLAGEYSLCYTFRTREAREAWEQSALKCAGPDYPGQRMAVGSVPAKKRVRQVRDALNKLKDAETLEEVARLLRV